MTLRDHFSDNGVMTVKKAFLLDMDGVLVRGQTPILVLSGITRQEDVERFPFRPTHVLPSVAEIQVG